LGRNRTNAEKIVPITRDQDSRKKLGRSSSTRSVAAPRHARIYARRHLSFNVNVSRRTAVGAR
jgi:hypothetical protein